jgi:hypothetical protein
VPRRRCGCRKFCPAPCSCWRWLPVPSSTGTQDKCVAFQRRSSVPCNEQRYTWHDAGRSIFTFVLILFILDYKEFNQICCHYSFKRMYPTAVDHAFMLWVNCVHLDRPKSTSLTSPFLVRSMLLPFTSRWITLFSHRWTITC